MTGDTCADLDRWPPVVVADEPVCAACVALGQTWVSLRQCLDCGNVACCDSSPHQHATAHFRESTHPVVQSAEPGEDWRWCYLHHVTG
jgi:monovalent cation/hydrogen antiporter